MQLRRMEAGVFLNGPQRIRGFHRSMLARVAGRDDAPPFFMNLTQERLHLSCPNLPGFIDHYHGTGLHILSGQKFADGLSVCETVFLQADHLLALRRDHTRRVPSVLQPMPDAPQNIPSRS